MPHYCIHSVDPDGHRGHKRDTYVADLGGALSAAEQLARDMIRSGPCDRTWRGWSIDIEDPSGHLILNIPVSFAPRLQHQPS